MKPPESPTGAPRLAVITGACGGMGAALAADLDDRGWATLRVDVVAEDRVSDTGFAQPTAYLRADVADEDDMARLRAIVADGAAERDAFLGIAAAGVISAGRTESLSRAEWERIIRVNLTGTFATLQSLIPAARAASTGRLIAIASDAGKTGEAWLPHYSASKFGVIGLVQALALELVEEGITVNAICPSIVDTPMMQQLAEQMSRATGDGDADEWRRRFVDEVPAGRACRPEDVAFAVNMLAQPGSAFITGQSINVSGGKEKH